MKNALRPNRAKTKKPGAPTMANANSQRINVVPIFLRLDVPGRSAATALGVKPRSRATGLGGAAMSAALGYLDNPGIHDPDPKPRAETSARGRNAGRSRVRRAVNGVGPEGASCPPSAGPDRRGFAGSLALNDSSAEFKWTAMK
jgi:hypothetical protein